MRTVAVLTGRVLQVRRIDTGQSVGYGASFKAQKPLLLATVALGYADGIMRAASNRGVAFVGGDGGGSLVPIVGRISMDLLTLDVGTLPAAPQPGDEVELLGDHVSLETLADAAGTNAYEILTGIRPRVPRYYQDGASARAGATEDEASARAGATKENLP